LVKPSSSNSSSGQTEVARSLSHNPNGYNFSDGHAFPTPTNTRASFQDQRVKRKIELKSVSGSEPFLRQSRATQSEELDPLRVWSAQFRPRSITEAERPPSPVPRSSHQIGPYPKDPILESLGNINIKSPNALMEFLLLLGLSAYAPLFQRQDIDLPRLMDVGVGPQSAIAIRSEKVRLRLELALEQLNDFNLLDF